jgi:hypothetical protein
MAPGDFNPNNPAMPPSIPLQDLSRPPDPALRTPGDERLRQPISGRARAILGNRPGFSGRVNTSGRYERVLAQEGSSSNSSSRLDVPHITTPRSAHQQTTFYDEGELSPVDVGDFQAAMGSVGLSFDNHSPPRPPIVTTTSTTGRTQLGIITETPQLTPFSRLDESADEEDDYFSPQETDRSPLTDRRFLQPISGAQISNSPGQRHDRHSQQSIRSSPGGMLGDNLPHVEHGLQVPGGGGSRRLSSQSTRSLTRSISSSAAASPLSHAGSVLRKMSQRVVNLSNEPEILEQITRQPSTKMATLEGPPSFPAMVEFHDDPQDDPDQVEKTSPLITAKPWEKPPPPENPLKGKTLGIFSPKSRVRLWLCELLVHPITEPAIFFLILLQTIFLAVDAATPGTVCNPVYTDQTPCPARPPGWSKDWINYALLILFVIYTLEIIARVIVSGFILNAEEYSTINRKLGFWRAMYQQVTILFASQTEQATMDNHSGHNPEQNPSIIRSFTSNLAQTDQPGHSRQAQRRRLARRAFLRHSFNRLDFLAVVSFWIQFVLSLSKIVSSRHLYVFQMLSCLRLVRLLVLTNGTSIILRSLKKAAPLLVHVAFLIGFFWLLFAIVGVQSFKASFRRTCVWFGDHINAFDNGTAQANNTLLQYLVNNISYNENIAPQNLQLCGGYINATNGDFMPYLLNDFITPGLSYHKGFLCPAQSLCVEGQNPYSGTVAFDNIFQSLELVFVIMSSNTFTDIMYDLTDSDMLVAALFFSFGIIIMTLWMMNLLIAVITSSFQVIREEGKTSAFTVDEKSEELEEEEKPKRRSTLRKFYDTTYWFWIVVIVLGLVVQSLRTASSSQPVLDFINNTESVVTFVLLIDIILRFISDPRDFHKHRRNWVDLGIAIIKSVIQIPAIRNSGQPYAWLTFFQIIRIYRVVLAVPLTRDLIVSLHLITLLQVRSC